MRTFSRSAYKLPGADGFLAASWLLFKSLFLSPAFDPDRMNMLTNVQWTIERHEWEYSVTIVPLVILIFGGWRLLGHIRFKDLVLKPNIKQYLQIAVIAALLFLPVALNTYSAGWNAFLKQLPLIKSASSLIRWFVIDVPIVILAAALIFEKMEIPSKYQWGIVIISLAAMVALNVLADRNIYLERNYDPAEIVESYYTVKTGGWTPQIKTIGVYVDANGQVKMLIKKNNLLIYGASQMYCYEPMFGYRLEDFPVKGLHPGPVLEGREGLLNIKNPACYVWPQANQCTPGDHFTVAQKKAAQAFVNYRPFVFQMPAVQKAANWINGLTLMAAILFLLFYAAKKLYPHPDISS
jgi:hypothetical protein